ncbi:hypothetical protein A9Q68_09575 [Streptococcus bovimastitidis]|uniref:Uncharacterized protein n=1 Tax=Streptococcus bovimastitidis TaxID=1856638 RepID=A0A1L8MKV8_9STRE|nr:hypothetical protein [Streptococcus bovimastitidis]OJF71420.1 hypothetical protein A9Q68_09575 [Streptococcus bovimastitidis]
MDIEFFNERFSKIEESVKLIDIMEDSISNGSGPHRELAIKIGIPYRDLRSIYKAQELKLLVDYYTFCEQLMKHFIYSVLDVHAIDRNIHRKKYLNDNLNPSTFSPRVKYKEIEDNLNKYLYTSPRKIKLLSFCIESDIRHKHDELILARHTYAHKGEEPTFSILGYVKSNLALLKYFLNDFQNIEVDLSNRLELQEAIIQILEEQKKLQKLDLRNKNWKERFDNLRKVASDTQMLLSKLEINSETYFYLESQLREFQKIDLRRSLSKNKEIISIISLESS